MRGAVTEGRDGCGALRCGCTAGRLPPHDRDGVVTERDGLGAAVAFGMERDGCDGVAGFTLQELGRDVA